MSGRPSGGYDDLATARGCLVGLLITFVTVVAVLALLFWLVGSCGC